jgi:cobalt-precorrin-7 (C5)-methyltransferase
LISVVGIGPGHPDYITPFALKRIRKADVLIGGRRQLKLFEHIPCEKIIFKNEINFDKALNHPGNVVVLASGEPGLYGILDLVLKYRRREDIDVIPGISSIQYMMARLAIPMKDMTVVSIHGREGDLTAKAMQFKTIVVLTDREHNPQYIAQKLKKNDIIDVTIYVGQNLSYEDEIIESFSVEKLSKSKRNFGLNVVVITRCGNMDLASQMSSL